MATWIIGDIHGCIRPLEQVLRQIPDSDRLVFLGDYIDRGPHPRAVVERLLAEKERSVFVRGNHEDAMLAHFGRLDFALEFPELIGPNSHWLRANFGGQATLQSYGVSPSDPWEALPAAHREFFEGSVFFHEAPDFVAVHAGLRVDGAVEPALQDVDDLMWIRWDWVSRESEWPGKLVYFGHFSSIQMFGREGARRTLQGVRSLGLDTGCGYGGFLSAWCHETGTLIQVSEHI